MSGVETLYVWALSVLRTQYICYTTVISITETHITINKSS